MSNALPEQLSREVAELLDVMSDSGYRRREFSSLVMGPLAALLVIKRVGRDELSLGTLYDTLAVLERNVGRDLDDDELEREWEQPAEPLFVEALKQTVADHASTNAATRYVANVAPLLNFVAGTPFLRVALGMASETEVDTPDGRTKALERFDKELRRAKESTGESTTPAPVADLMLELVKPRPGDRVYDPCFGFGGFLVGAARKLQATARKGPSCDSTDDESRTSVFGFEINRVSYAIGLCRTLLAGIERPCLELGSALHRPLAVDGFDCILAAPPWGAIAPTRGSADVAPASHGGMDRLAGSAPSIRQLPFPSRHSENLFLQHAMANLRPGGRAVVALPERMLFGSGSDRRVREALVSGYRVDAVISLPAGAFAPHTNVALNLVAFRREEERPAVRFVRVSPMAWDTNPGAGNGSAGCGDVQRRLADMVFVAELAEKAAPGGLEAWDVPVRDLAHRNYELVAKKTGSEALAADLKRIVAADRSVRVERLERVARVRAGRWYARRVRTETRSAPGVVAGLLRFRDIADTGIRPPSRFLIDDSKRPVDEEDSLRRDDLVVTTSGAVGKVGLISEVSGAVGSVAAAGLAVVRKSGGVTPDFLMALLRSPTYQNWLSGHARGAAVERLSIQTLCKLPIPVPPPAIQDAVLDELGGTRGDALGVLARLLAREERSSFAVWLDTPFVAQLAAGRISGAPDGGKALAAATDALVSLDVRIARGSELASPAAGDQRTGTWLDAARQAAAALDGVASIPSGAGRLAVLEVGRARLYEALHALDTGDGPTVNRLRAFTRGVTGIVEEEIHAMQESITLRIVSLPTEVVVGMDREVQLRLTNSSHVPLRNLRVEARPFEARPRRDLDQTESLLGKGHVAYLAEGDTCGVPLAVRAGDATQSVRIIVSWQAQRLNGTAVRDEKEIELRVLSKREEEPSGDLGASPYIVGSPIDRHDMFFGRADVMERIKRQLRGRAHANVILLEGNRRSGKTSILRQLGKADAPAGWVPVYCSFQEAEGDAMRAGVTTRNVFRLLARKTGWTLYDAGVETWFPDLPSRDPGQPFKRAFRAALDQAFAGEHPFEIFALYLAAAIEAAKPRRILLMLDEFDKLQEGIDAGITSSQVPQNIRHLFQHQPGLSAIITGSRRLKTLREEYWSALFGIGYRVGVSALPVDEARRLVTRPVEGMLSYLPQACDRLAELCACHPFLVQSLCNRVFEQAASGNKRTITLDIVEKAADEMTRDNEHFRTLWDYTGSERRRLLLMLFDRLSEGPDAVNLDLLQVKLDELKVPVHRAEELMTDVEELKELELIDWNDSYRGGTYRLALPLMARWLQMNVDFREAVARARHEAIEAQP